MSTEASSDLTGTYPNEVVIGLMGVQLVFDFAFKARNNYMTSNRHYSSSPSYFVTVSQHRQNGCAPGA